MAVKSFLDRSSPSYAQMLVDRIIARADSLESQPQLGAEVVEYGDPSLREVYEHPYRLLYRISVDGGVEIVAVVHNSRRLPVHPPG